MSVTYIYQERPKAGQKQRIGSGDWEQLVNKQQRRLVRAYDQWAAPVKREIADRALQGQSVVQISAYLDRQIPVLEGRLIEVTNKGIIGAAQAAAGTRADLPSIQGITRKQMRDNMLLVRENLIPNIHEKWTLAIAQGKAFDRKALNAVINATRSMPAQYAGGSWVAIFEVERGLGHQRELERAGQGLVAERIRWTLDPRAEHCRSSPGFYGCVDLAGEYESWAALPTVPAGSVTCRGNAILPDNTIDYNGLELATRLCYRGPAVKLRTQSGVEITVTANHPILTPQGWLCAKFLNKGDYVINSTFGQPSMVIVNNNHQDMPSLIQEIWDSLSVISRIYTSPSSPVMANDFHGDGRFLYGNVDIVLADSQLGNTGYTPSPDAVNNDSLHRGLLATGRLATNSPLVKVDRGSFPASYGIMASDNMLGSLFGIHQRPFHSLGFGLGSKMNSLSFECMGNSPAAYPQITRQLQDTLTRLVTLDEIVDIINFDYLGHCYDLQTQNGYYIANSIISQRQGIVLSNCRCHIEIYRDGKWQRRVYED